MHGEFAGLVTEHGRKPEVARELSFEMYEDWATEVLIRPGDLRYYRRKTMEETTEFLQEMDPEKTVEEAGDLIWTLVTGRKLVKDVINVHDTPDYYNATLRSITEAWQFTITDEELTDWLQSNAYLFQRKMKLALWVEDEPDIETRRDYIIGVIDALMPQLIAAIAKITKSKTGKGIEDILMKNIEKLEDRIAHDELDKTNRQEVASL